MLRRAASLAAEVLGRPLDDLSLSVRSRNALTKIGVAQVGQLLDLVQDEQALWGVRGLGEKSVHELTDIAGRIAEQGSLEGLTYAPGSGRPSTLSVDAVECAAVPEEILSTPRERLALSTRIANVLARMEVRDVRQILDLAMCTRGFANVAGLGATSVHELQALVASVASQHSLEGLMREVEEPAPIVIDLGPGERPHVLDLLPGIVQQALREAEAEVLKARFGLDGNPPCALQQIGLARGITRERVRQIEANGLRRLREFLLGEASRLAHVPLAPAPLVAEVTEVLSLLGAVIASVDAEARVLQVLTDRYGSAPRRCDLDLLLETFGFAPVRWPGNPAPPPGSRNPAPRKS